MPPRKKRAFTVPDSSSDGENAPPPPPPPPPEPKPAKKRKANASKSVDPHDGKSPPPKKPRGRPRKTAVPDDDHGEPPAKKPRRQARKTLDEDEECDSPDNISSKKQKSKTYAPVEGELQEIYLTQLPQEDSSPPWRIRGPIWQKPKDKQPLPKPPLFYKPPPPPPLPAQPTSQVAGAPRVVPTHPTQQRPQNPKQHGMPSVRSPHENAKPIQRSPSPKQPGPFYSSPFSSPRPTRSQSPQRDSPKVPPEPSVPQLPTAHDLGDDETPVPPRPVAPVSETDMELDLAGFSSSPPSAPVQTRQAGEVNEFANHAEAVQSSMMSERRSPNPAIPAVGAEDFPSSPPNPVRPHAVSVLPPGPPAASDRDEFDDEDLDDIDESMFQRLVSQGPPAASKPPTHSAPNPNGAVRGVDQELLDLPSDAFSLSSVVSPGLQRAGRAQDQAILVSSQDNRATAGPQRLAAPLNGLRQTTLFGGSNPVPQSQISKRQNWPAADRDEPPTHHKIDQEAMKTWVYPTNLGNIRDYQFNIVQRGLYHNLLVALPTGLGKTFIAATIMLNFLRWTTEAQVVFVAPTKPLVAQQIDACLGIAGIRRSQTTMLTGEVDPGLRAGEWQTKRVFFMTPQTMMNDLKSGYCDAKKIVLLVVDEAHRATGAYAYVEIVKFIRRFNQSFRVLALTATPGADVETVQKVIDGLEISRVEIRMENSMDIQPFIQKREVEKKVLRDNKDLLVAKDLFSKAVKPVLIHLNGENAYWGKDPLGLSLYGLNQARTNWTRSDAGRNASYPVKGKMNSIFQALISLARGIDVLKFHGIRPFYRILRDYKTEATTKWTKEITKNPNFEKLMTTLQDWTAKPDYLGHPKLEHLRSYVLNHFLDAEEGQDGSQTKVMVFAHWRDSAEDIVRVLKLNEPMIRPHVFVGQAATKTSEAMDQKRQEEVVRQFKAGVYNTLVATSIGEEGLDIGEVDLIVCYDQKASPIRMLQRMGRTGRKRKGKILLLQMEGKEESDAEKAKDAYASMQEKISKGDEFNFHTNLARRIVPKDISPVADMRHIDIPIENSQPELPMPRAGKGRKTKRPAKKFQMPDGVITGFISAAAGLNGGGQPRAKKRGKKEPPVEPVEDAVPAEETFLSSHDERMLQKFYQFIHDADDDREIAPPALTLHPERQRHSGRTRYISTHSRATTSFVTMVNRMHAIDQCGAEELEEKFRDSLHMSDIERGQSADEISEDEWEHNEPGEMGYAVGTTPIRSHGRIMDEVGEGGSSSPPPTDPRMRVRSQAIDLGTQDTEGEEEMEDELLDSEMAEFIADDAEPVETFSSSLPSLRAARRTKLFTSSQRDEKGLHDDDDDDDDDEDDFPDISQLVRKKADPTKRHHSDHMVGDSDDEDDEGAEPVNRHAGKRRRVVDDSESD